jgi:uncharacterized membrane protein
MERHTRTVFKTLSWRIVATSSTLLFVYLFTRDIVITAGVSITEIAVKTIIYYLHERLWNTINFGRKIPNPPCPMPPTYRGFSATETDKQRKNNV